jgi:hypothetical protein
MVTTNEILNFALKHKEFSRKELLSDFESRNQIKSPGNLSEQLNRLLKAGQLTRIERGVYKLAKDTGESFSVVCSEEMRQINRQIKNSFHLLIFVFGMPQP